MTIRIYNSLTKKKEELVPANNQSINMYSCGVTVYDQCHIGHARSLYVFDVIRRYFEYRGLEVHFIRNITDIDDKIINKAHELKKDWKEVVEQNITAYRRDLQGLGVREADHEPRATDQENIEEMRKYIGGMIEKGFAYEAEGDVYFDVRAYNAEFDYGELSGQSIDQMEEAVRIDKDAKKKDPLDFALWKKFKEGEPSWDSPWGPGRPGWHIECSCMSRKHLKCETLDIHAGGRDLIFPHHENEIAQAQAYNGKKFANYWIHHGLLTINKQKMAKSLGNFITIQDALKKYGADDLKMFFLSSHYGSSIDFSEERMQEAHKAVDRFDILFWKAAGIVEGQESEPCEADFIQKARSEFVEALDDDFNTPRALAALFDLVTQTNKFIDNDKGDSHYAGIIVSAVDTIEDITKNVLGLFSDNSGNQLTPNQEALLEERKAARQGKDFKRSDEIRGLLKAEGIIVEDGKDGQTWRRA